MTREKVIEGLEYLITAYAFHCDDAECLGEAVELLKEQDDIVKCKTCKYWDDTSEGRYIGGWCFCDRLKFSTSPEWYCADGEGKTDAVDRR